MSAALSFVERPNNKGRQYNPADEITTGPIMVITADDKGVVMHEQDLRE